MIKATIIFGEEAVDQFHDINEIPSDDWIKNHSGMVVVKEFKTPNEYEAYLQGLSDANGWEKYQVIKKIEIPRLVCKNCKGHDVACDARINPNSGAILNIFDEMDGACEKCGEVELMEPEDQNLPDTATTK